MRNLGVVDSDLSVPRHKDIKIDHNLFVNRDMENQHPASAIKYDNENTEFNANNMQDIIDELDFNDKIVSNAQGTLISITDSSERKLENLRIYGKTTRDGIPSTANQIPLVNIGDSGEINLQICKKNLLDLSNAVNATNVVDSIDSDGTVHIKSNLSVQWGNTYLGKMILVSGEKYTISGNVSYGRIGLSKLANLDGPAMDTSVPDTDMSINACGILHNSMKQQTFIARETCIVYVWYCTDTGNTGVNESFSLQLMVESGEHYTGYENPSVQTFTIQTPNGLRGIPVNSGGNYIDENGQQWICDEIDFEREMYVQRIGVLDLGALNWARASGNRFVSAQIANMKLPASKAVAVNALCSHYVVSNFNSVYAQTNTHILAVPSDSSTISIVNQDYSDASEFKNALSGVIFCYEMAEFIEVLLTAEEIAVYEALYTNKPNTTIINDSNAHMSVDYIVNNHTAEYVSKRFEENTPKTNTNFVTTVTPSDNTIYAWTMTGNLTINATSAIVCPTYGSHFILDTGSAARTLTINAVSISGNVATTLPANTSWEISILRGRVIMVQL